MARRHEDRQRGQRFERGDAPQRGKPQRGAAPRGAPSTGRPPRRSKRRERGLVVTPAGAPTTTKVSGGGSGGLEGRVIDDSAAAAAISKAGTAAFFSTQGSALTTRTAGYVVQEHFPPQIDPSAGGPIFGVQFSNLRCSDVDRGPGIHAAAVANLPLGLGADPGGLPLYKNGVAVGGIGVEGQRIGGQEQAGSAEAGHGGKGSEFHAGFSLRTIYRFAETEISVRTSR